MSRGVLKRIDIDLDSKIRDIANKNKIRYREASRELARAADRVNNRSLYREVKF